MRYLDGPRPRLFGHRGAAGVAPENTLASFRAALSQGADRLELDVHATGDGQPIVLHDATLERTTDGRGEVRRQSVDEIRRLDAGCRFQPLPGHAPIALEQTPRVPTLEEVLVAFPEVALNIEIKQAEPPMVSSVLDVLDRHSARDRVLLAAEQDEIMRDIRSAAPDVLTGFTASEAIRFFESVRSGAADPVRWAGCALQVPAVFQGMVVVDATFVQRAHELGIEVHVWTVNDERDMLRLVELGVDGIVTDVPAALARALGRRG